MKWNKEQEQQLKALCFEEKSNKEIAAIMEIELSDVHNGRSRFGVTIDKVAAAKGKNEQAAVADQKVKRDKTEIQEEITKVEAVKKVWKCTQRLEVLREELKEAK